MAIHAWHLRNWFSPTVDPILGIAPAEKYRRIGRRLQMLRRQNPRLWGYCSMAWLRLICGRLRRGRAA
jgi:hypothetical protein